jgi:hypothetical protein
MIVKDTIGRFYIIMLKPLKPLRTKTEGTYKNVITLDPSVRTFLSGVDTEGNGFKIRKYGMNSLQRKLLRVDSIQCSINQKTNGPFEYNHKRRQNMRKAMRRECFAR